MSRFDKYIIEARTPDGGLLLGDYPQPESVFGMLAITGISSDLIAEGIFRKIPTATLDGSDILNWPKLINPAWTARRKTW